jgi:hypothetical protein
LIILRTYKEKGQVLRCRSQLYSAVGITFFKDILKADPIRTLQLKHSAVWTEEFPRYYTGSTAYLATYLAGWASWLVLATVPVLDRAGNIGLRGNGLTPSKIDDFLSEPSL